MPLNEYKCQNCHTVRYMFENEWRRFWNADTACTCPDDWEHKWELMPPRAVVIMATSQYMQPYQLDSWVTVYELDRQLNIEAREAKELEFYQDHKRNA